MFALKMCLNYAGKRIVKTSELIHLLRSRDNKEERVSAVCVCVGDAMRQSAVSGEECPRLWQSKDQNPPFGPNSA